MPAPPYPGMRYFSCCLDCPNRHTACSARCIDYMMAKATKGAEQQLLRERYTYCKRRNTNGRK